MLFRQEAPGGRLDGTLTAGKNSQFEPFSQWTNATVSLPFTSQRL